MDKNRRQSVVHRLQVCFVVVSVFKVFVLCGGNMCEHEKSMTINEQSAQTMEYVRVYVGCTIHGRNLREEKISPSPWEALNPPKRFFLLAKLVQSKHQKITSTSLRHRKRFLGSNKFAAQSRSNIYSKSSRHFVEAITATSNTSDGKCFIFLWAPNKTRRQLNFTVERCFSF